MFFILDYLILMMLLWTTNVGSYSLIGIFGVAMVNRDVEGVNSGDNMMGQFGSQITMTCIESR